MNELFNPLGQLTIKHVIAFMDGGSIMLMTHDTEFNSFDIMFVQKLILTYERPLPIPMPCPGSLLLNEKEVDIRSTLESNIISAIKTANWGTMKAKEYLLNDCIGFVLSEDYIKIAKQVGHIK